MWLIDTATMVNLKRKILTRNERDNNEVKKDVNALKNLRTDHKIVSKKSSLGET